MKLKKLSDVIRELARAKNEKGLTYEKIAFYANLSKTTVGDLFEGRTKAFSFQTVMKIAKAMDYAIDFTLKKKRG